MVAQCRQRVLELCELPLVGRGPSECVALVAQCVTCRFLLVVLDELPGTRLFGLSELEIALDVVGQPATLVDDGGLALEEVAVRGLQLEDVSLQRLHRVV